MTPEERKLVTELFDRLATLENSLRDPEADSLVQNGLRRAPNAAYALVQTALVQDEALKRADARIRELEADLGVGNQRPPQQGGFLDNMRDSIFGRREPQRPGSVPSIRPGEQAGEGYGQPMGGGYGQPMGGGFGQPMGGQSMGGQTMGGGYGQPAGGGSFLGNAAATAAGVIGGSMLLNGIRSMMGHQGGAAHAAVDPASSGASSSPWAGKSNSDLARQAGIDDIGRGAGGSKDPAGTKQGFLDDTADPNDPNADDGDDDGDDFEGEGDDE